MTSRGGKTLLPLPPPPPPAGGDGADEHLQAAEVPAGPERVQPLPGPGSPLCSGLPAEELRSSHRQRLPASPAGRTPAVGLWTGSPPQERSHTEGWTGGNVPPSAELGGKQILFIMS